jgi:hypothetical protein
LRGSSTWFRSICQRCVCCCLKWFAAIFLEILVVGQAQQIQSPMRRNIEHRCLLINFYSCCYWNQPFERRYGKFYVEKCK